MGYTPGSGTVRIAPARGRWQAKACPTNACKTSCRGGVCFSLPRADFFTRLFPDIFSNLFGFLDFAFQHHGRRARNAAILAHAPEVHDHEQAGDDRDGHAVPRSEEHTSE